MLVQNVETDKSNVQRSEFNYLGPDELLTHFVPLLFRIDDFTEDCCHLNNQG
jgi:hypothetical protein